jgi:DNA-3-methyladenine glycosylase I
MPGSSMEAPEQVVPQSLGDYLDMMCRGGKQSGMSWKVIEAKWPSTREAFQGFDLDKVAEMTEDDIDALATDTRVIRSRRKLAAIVGNAQCMIELE